jgi:DNA-directed RNA polymerase subunit RPC12/RpoP
VHIHPTPEEDKFCPCGALISEDDHNELCPKCRSRLIWLRRTEGRRRHARREV